MKKILFFILIILSFSSLAQNTSYKVVLDLTSSDTKTWEIILNNLENIRRELGPETKMQVVTHGGGIDFLRSKSAFQTERIKKLHQLGVTFIGCENTLKRKSISPQELYPFVTTVPSGLAEVIRKQSIGWAYLKIGH